MIRRKSKSKSKRSLFSLYIISISVLILIISIAVAIEYYILSSKDKNDAFVTNEMLLEQTIIYLDKFKSDEALFLSELKDEYLSKAKAIDYIISSNPSIEHNVQELNNLASIMYIDEIHIFNTNGVIYSGNVPDYYGLSIDSGDQIRFFKPMLYSKRLSLCQEVTPNTAEGKRMMYAMVWGENGDRLIQVGITPSRLISDMRIQNMADIFEKLPVHEGYSVYIAEKDSGKIVASTNRSNVNLTLDDIGFKKKKIDLRNVKSFTKDINGKIYSCSFKFYRDYAIAVIFDLCTNHSNMAIALGIEFFYLALAGTVIILMFLRIIKAHREKNDQFSVLHSMSEIYYSMHLNDLVENTVTQYVLKKETIDYSHLSKDPIAMMKAAMEDMVTKEYEDALLKFTDMTTIANRMIGKKTISKEFITKKLGWVRASFIAIDVDDNNRPIKLLFTIQVIDDEKRKEEILLKKSCTDELTRCLNRRAYDEDVYKLYSEYVYISLDVNGLKVINDTKGHEAGDELIVGAANCIKKAFIPYGSVYRTGGDEFIAILTSGFDKFDNIKQHFESIVKDWKGKIIETLTISIGYVFSSEFPNFNMEKIAHVADERMYDNKNKFYQKKGIDRLGQQEASLALSSLYSTILRVDLAKDTYSVISTDKPEIVKNCYVSNSLSKWFLTFAEEEQIHQEDLNRYLNVTNLSNMIEYFELGNNILSLSFRNVSNGENRAVVMDIVPTNKYSEQNKTLFICIKYTDKQEIFTQ